MYSKTQIHSPSAGQSGRNLLPLNPILRELLCQSRWAHGSGESGLPWPPVSEDYHYTYMQHSKTVRIELYFQKVTKILFQPGDHLPEENVYM